MQGLLAGAGSPSPMPSERPTPNQAPARRASESQETYNIVSGQAQKFLWKTGYDTVVKNLKESAKNPALAMRGIIGNILKMIVESAAKSGKKIPPKVVVQAGMDLARSLSEIAQKVGALNKENEARVAEDAYFHGLSEIAKSKALEPQEAQEYLSLLQQLAQAKQGQNAPQEAMQ